jgi:diguanylate cyclase (GGDEF)-like protein
MNTRTELFQRASGPIVLLALAYGLLGWLSLKVAIPPDYVSLVFLPAGLAVTVVLLRGPAVLPGVFLGALLVQWLAHQQVGAATWTWTTLVPALGATLQAAATAFALRRWITDPDRLDAPGSVLMLLLVVAPVGSAINAGLSVPTLALGGVLPWPEVPYSIWTWWIGDALGVTLLLPAALALYGEPARRWTPRVRSVALPMLVSLVVVLGGVAAVRSTHEQSLTQRFEHETDEAFHRLQRRLDALTDAVSALAQVMALGERVDRDAFRGATATWLTRYPGILNFGWSPLVTAAEREAFEQTQARVRNEPFQVLGRDPQGRTFAACPAARHLPITLVEPLERNRSVLGLDILVLPATAAVAERAIDGRRAQVSPPFHLVQETGAQKGVVMYLPVYDRALPDQLRGIVSAAFRVSDLLEATFGPSDGFATALDLCLLEWRERDEPQLLSGPSSCMASPSTAATHLPSRTMELNFGDRRWLLRSRPGAALLGSSRDWTSWAVTATGLAAVGLLGGFLLVITGQSRRTERLVEQRTRELAQSNASLQRLAHFDPLTGLFNRSEWNRLAHQGLEEARRHGDLLGVLFIDIDRFKHINDSLGHSLGDELLRALAQRMTACLRGRDVLARLGGDEFVVLLPRLRDRHGAHRAAEKLMQELTRPMSLAGHDVTVTASLGVALYPVDGDSLEVLVRHADIAMYAAKDSGRNALRFFSTDLRERLSEHLLLERELRRALSDEGGPELHLAYQPQIDLRSAAVVGVEALLRWQHPTLGSIAPDRFIPVAEQCGLIEVVDRWVLRRSMEQLRQWDAQGLPPLRVAVNISAQHIGRADFLPQLEQTLHRAGPLAERIELEITESMLMQGQAELRERLLSLTRLGPTLALDDFGTGYSNLGYLKRLPLDKLKIDRSFVTDLPGLQEDEALVRAIVSMAHDLGLQVLAEGVETEAQRDFLRHLGCDLMQGWLEAPAMQPEALESWLRQRGSIVQNS